VGSFIKGTTTQTLILRMKGGRWTRVKSPDPGSDSALFGVTATSAGNAWAVGEFTSSNTEKSLILRWNGARWTKAASPSPGVPTFLSSVTATSGGNAWAAGFFGHGGADRTLILRWNGKKWAKVASPNQGRAGTNNALNGVFATSPRSAWAVGTVPFSAGTNTLMLHWNGTRWSLAKSPDPGTDNFLNAVAASSSSNMWAVGRSDPPAKALAFHCC
jgi:hypothetical protein